MNKELPNLIRSLNNDFWKAQLTVQRKSKIGEPIKQDVIACVEMGVTLLTSWLEE